MDLAATCSCLQRLLCSCELCLPQGPCPLPGKCLTMLLVCSDGHRSSWIVCIHKFCNPSSYSCVLVPKVTLCRGISSCCFRRLASDSSLRAVQCALREFDDMMTPGGVRGFIAEWTECCKFLNSLLGVAGASWFGLTLSFRMLSRTRATVYSVQTLLAQMDQPRRLPEDLRKRHRGCQRSGFATAWRLVSYRGGHRSSESLPRNIKRDPSLL